MSDSTDSSTTSFSAATSSTTVSETTPAATVSHTSTTTADSSHPTPVTSSFSQLTPSTSSFLSSSTSASFLPSSSFSASSSSDASVGGSSEDAGGDNEVAPEEESTAEYAPVVRLETIATTSGEEDDEPIYTQRAALYRFDTVAGEWKERGRGDAKLLKNKQTGKVRVLLRQEKTLKCCVNHIVLPSLDLKPNAGSDRSWTWRTTDYAAEQPEDQTFAIRFKDSDSHITSSTAQPSSTAQTPPFCCTYHQLLLGFVVVLCCTAANVFKAKWDEVRESNKQLL